MFWKNLPVVFGLFGGCFLGMLNVLSLRYTTAKLDMKLYFLKTAVKFIVLIALFYGFLRLNANPLALLGGFTISIMALGYEVLSKCQSSKKQ